MKGDIWQCSDQWTSCSASCMPGTLLCALSLYILTNTHLTAPQGVKYCYPHCFTHEDKWVSEDLGSHLAYSENTNRKQHCVQYLATGLWDLCP
jgi:hypothetical protein